MAGKITISDDCDREGEENMRKQKLMLGAILVAAGLLMGCAGTAKGSTEEDTGTAAVEEVQADENGNASTEEDTISEDEKVFVTEYIRQLRKDILKKAGWYERWMMRYIEKLC